MSTLAPPTGPRITATDWALNWQGKRYTSADLTGEHCAVIAELLGTAPSWDVLDVRALHPALGPLQVMALLAAFRIVEEQVQGAAARQAFLAMVKQSTVAELLEAIEIPEG